MKMRMEVECTPEEARACMGLPDLRPMQTAVMERVERNVLDSMAVLSPEALLRAWFPMIQSGPVTEMMTNLFRSFAASGTSTGGEPSRSRD